MNKVKSKTVSTLLLLNVLGFELYLKIEIAI